MVLVDGGPAGGCLLDDLPGARVALTPPVYVSATYKSWELDPESAPGRGGGSVLVARLALPRTQLCSPGSRERASLRSSGSVSTLESVVIMRLMRVLNQMTVRVQRLQHCNNNDKHNHDLKINNTKTLST